MKTTSGNANGHSSERKALDFEVTHHVKQRTALLSNEVSSRNDAVVKDKFSSVGGSHSSLVEDLLTNAESRHAFLDEEG